MKRLNLKKNSDCFYCNHWKEKVVLICDAFPDGIPFDITSGQFNHHETHKGDHGIRFELNKKKIKREKLIQQLLKGEK